MAKVIEFYIPSNFRKKAEPAPAEHCGKVIDSARGRGNQLESRSHRASLPEQRTREEQSRATGKHSRFGNCFQEPRATA